MLGDRTFKGQGPPIVEKARPTPQAHEWLCPKFCPSGDAFAEIGERGAHIV
jgi:hypothetical protein